MDARNVFLDITWLTQLLVSLFVEMASNWPSRVVIQEQVETVVALIAQYNLAIFVQLMELEVFVATAVCIAPNAQALTIAHRAKVPIF